MDDQELRGIRRRQRAGRTAAQSVSSGDPLPIHALDVIAARKFIDYTWPMPVKQAGMRAIMYGVVDLIEAGDGEVVQVSVEYVVQRWSVSHKTGCKVLELMREHQLISLVQEYVAPAVSEWFMLNRGQEIAVQARGYQRGDVRVRHKRQSSESSRRPRGKA